MAWSINRGKHTLFPCSLSFFFFEIKKKKDTSEGSFKAMLEKKESMIRTKESEIEEWKQKMDEMAHEFGVMLKVFFLFVCCSFKRNKIKN